MSPGLKSCCPLKVHSIKLAALLTSFSQKCDLGVPLMRHLASKTSLMSGESQILFHSLSSSMLLQTYRAFQIPSSLDETFSKKAVVHLQSRHTQSNHSSFAINLKLDFLFWNRLILWSTVRNKHVLPKRQEFH